MIIFSGAFQISAELIFKIKMPHQIGTIIILFCIENRSTERLFAQGHRRKNNKNGSSRTVPGREQSCTKCWDGGTTVFFGKG